jgi:hypothetical protein
LSISANERACTFATPRCQFALQQLLQQLHQISLRHAVHFGEKLLRQDRDVRLLPPRGGKDVDHPLGRDSARHDLAHGPVEVLLRPRIPRRALGEDRMLGSRA